MRVIFKRQREISLNGGKGGQMLTRIEVKEYIERTGVKQLHIARKIGVSKSKFCQFLSGKSNLTNTEKEKLSQETGIA